MKPLRKLTIAALIIASVGLTSCTQELPNDKNSKGSNGSSVSASPSATPLPTMPATVAPVPPNKDATKEALPLPGEEGGVTTEQAQALSDAMEKNPMQIDIDYSLKQYGDPKLETVFPKADFDVKEATRYGLSLYQDLAGLQDFYEPRDTSKDFDLVLPFADKMSAELLEKTKTDIQATGKFNGIPTANSDGSLGTTAEGVQIDTAGVPTSYWNGPAINLSYNEQYGNVVQIAGKRTIAIPAASGEMIEVQQTYAIDVAPSGDKQWIVTELYWTVESAEVVK